MESSYDIIKTRLKTILQSERTIEFLNKLTDFGISLDNSPQINNKFIKEVFQGEGINGVGVKNGTFVIVTSLFHSNIGCSLSLLINSDFLSLE